MVKTADEDAVLAEPVIKIIRAGDIDKKVGATEHGEAAGGERRRKSAAIGSEPPARRLDPDGIAQRSAGNLSRRPTDRPIAERISKPSDASRTAEGKADAGAGKSKELAQGPKHHDRFGQGAVGQQT